MGIYFYIIFFEIYKEVSQKYPTMCNLKLRLSDFFWNKVGIWDNCQDGTKKYLVIVISSLVYV